MKIISILSVFLINFFLQGIRPCKVETTFELGEKCYSTTGYKLIRMTHFNSGSRVVIIPDEWQQSTYNGDAEAVVEIQKQNKAGRYEKLQLQDIDVDYMVADRKLMSLKSGDKLKQELNFGMLYDLNAVGNYKVRVCIPLKKFNADCCSNYSPWMYFRIADNCQ